MEEDERRWQARAKRVLRAELTRAAISYEELSIRLKAMGAQDIAPANLINKVSRGTFSAAFFLQCLEAAGSRVVLLDEPRALRALTEDEALKLEETTRDLVERLD